MRRSLTCATLCALAAVALAGAPACRSPSELFPERATDGGPDGGPRGEPATVDTSFQAPSGEALGLKGLSNLVRLPDDRLLLAGVNWAQDRAALVRLHPDGELDLSYGDGGIALSSCVANPGSGVAWGPALLSDGTAVLVTWDSTSVGVKLAVASPDGRDVRCVPCADLVVGGQSIVRADVVGNLGLGATTDDGLLLLGAGPTGSGPRLFRLTATCGLVRGFADGGMLVFPVGGSMLHTVLQLSDGTIYVAGRHGFYEAGLYAFDASGRPVAGLDGGRVSLPAALAGLGTVTAASADQVVGAGSATGGVLVFRVAAGALDPTFASSTADLAGANAGGLALANTGDVFLSASASSSPCNLLRFFPDGGLDTTFPPGLRPQPFTTSCAGIAVQSDGRVVLAGPLFRSAPLSSPTPPRLVRIWP